MKLVILWDAPAQLRNALLQLAHDFKAANPAYQFTAMVQSTPTVPVAEVLREPALSITQVLERRPLGDGPPARSERPFERAIAAVLADPDLPDRTIATKIGVSHQTVGRARESLKGKPGAKQSSWPVDGPRGPSRPGGPDGANKMSVDDWRRPTAVKQTNNRRKEDEHG